MNYPDRMRYEARKETKKLFLKQNEKCYHCGGQLILSNDKRIIKERKNTFIYLENGLEKIALKPTIDHLTPIRDGGTNDDFNLVLSCETCNRERTRTPKIIKTNVCKKCGNEYRYTKRGTKSKKIGIVKGANSNFCKDCNRENNDNYLILICTRT